MLRTFSKIAGLAGLRVGYAIAHARTIDRLNRVRAPYNVNRLAQVAAVAALEDAEHLARTRRLVLDERAFLSASLRAAASVSALAGQLPARQVPIPRAAMARLLRAGLIVRDGAAVGFPGHLRIAIGDHHTNERLLQALTAR